MDPRTTARIISVGGGKGGVGKSVVAANLAVAMAQAGSRVILVDADLGAANQQTLFGIERPGPTLHSLLTHEISSLHEATVPTEVPNLNVIGGSGAVVGAANIDHEQKQLLTNHIRQLEADVIVIDVGAGVSFNMLDLFELGDLRLIVTSPQITAIQNAYSFLKNAVFRSIRRFAPGAAELELIEAGPRETEKLPQLVERLRQSDEEFASIVEELLGIFSVYLVGNQIHEAREAGVFHAVSRMIRDFLGVAAPVLGVLRTNRAIHESVSRRRPFLLSGPWDEDARAIQRMARQLLTEPLAWLPRRDERPAASSAAITTGDAPLAEAPLPDLKPFTRRHERYPVDWRARLEDTLAQFPVRVREISLGGALVETPRPLEIGQRWTLVIHEFGDCPPLPVEVRSMRSLEHTAGLQFIAFGRPPAALVAHFPAEAQSVREALG